MPERNRVVPLGMWHLTDIQTRVLLAVMSGCRTDGDIVRATNVGRMSVHGALRRLRDLELVTWEPALRGTIIAKVARVDTRISNP